MTTKYYKYLYKLMKDDLTDSRAELDYAYCAKEDGEAELAKYFGAAASERLNKKHTLYFRIMRSKKQILKKKVFLCAYGMKFTKRWKMNTNIC